MTDQDVQTLKIGERVVLSPLKGHWYPNPGTLSQVNALAPRGAFCESPSPRGPRSEFFLSQQIERA